MRTLLILMAFATNIGCASFHRCITKEVPFYWVDGSVSLMKVTTCRYVSNPSKN